MSPARKGIVFDIQRFAVHDGPGIRTAVFLKGCPLGCLWCHNPEGLDPEPELSFFPRNCLGCDACLGACGRELIVKDDGGRRVRRERCKACGKCAAVCPSGALVMSGRAMSPEEALREVLRDRPFYENSGGGVTLTGGEPLLQRRFSHELLRLCREAGIHTALETCAFAPWRHLELLLPVTDLFLLDIKLIDSEAHFRATGAPNERILRNAERLGASGAAVVVRVPLIPGYTDSEENLRAIAGFAGRIGARGVDLMAYHALGDAKWAALGKEAPIPPLGRISEERVAALREMVAAVFGRAVP